MTLWSRVRDAVGRPRGRLRAKTKPGLGDDIRWLEAERREDLMHETRRPGRFRTAFIVPDKDTKNRPPRSQSTHSSVEAG